MFNVVINNEQYDEYLSQKEKIKELVKECNDLRIKNNELENRVTRFSEIVTENYRLKMSINDLRANNKELKAKIKEPIASVTINPCCDSEEAYSPDNNTIINIKNLYLTNNYFSEEDENNGSK